MACQVIKDSKGEIQQVLAPNGKESKLFNDITVLIKDKEQALKQWAQVYTPQFKEWFKDSKVVDENGEPLLVYHNTNAEISRFESYAYFSENSNYWEKKNSIPVFLSIKNPVYTNPSDVQSLKSVEDKDGAIWTKEDALKLFSTIGMTPKAISEVSKFYEIVAFRPNQIKSLFNQGDFSAANDSIYMQKGDTSSDAVPSKLQTVLQKLYNKFGIEYSIVNNPNVKLRGWFADDKRGGNYRVVVNLAYANPDTPFHEYLHPFIAVLRVQNPKLYANLMEQMMTDMEGMKLYGQIREAYPEKSEAGIREEALVHYLGELAEQKYDKVSSPFNRFINWLKSLFKKIQIDFKTLSLDMTLSDIADLVIDDLYVADLRSMIQDARCLSNEQKVDTDLTYASVYEKIKDRVAILSRTIKNRKKGDQFIEDISALNEIIQNEDEVTSINNFVSNSIYYINAASKRFESLRNSVKNADQLSKEELSYNLNVLGEIQQLLNVYQALDSVESLLFREGLNSKDETFQKLSDAVRQKNLIIEDFKSFSLTYITEWLYPYLEPTIANLKAQGKTDLILTKEKFREQMVQALRDISAAGTWLGTTINSRDPVSAAIGLALKDVMYDNHVKDTYIKNLLSEEYEKATGSALYKSSKDEAAFNQQFMRVVKNWEQVGLNEDGSPRFEYVERLAFYEEYQMDEFDKAKDEFYATIGKRPTDPKLLKIWKKAQGEWFASNTRVNPRADEIINEKRKTLTKRAFEDWLLTNTKELDELQYGYGKKLSDYYAGRVLKGSHNYQKGTFRVFSGELIQPAEKYKDKKFPTLMKNEYYKQLYTTYKKANEQLGTYGLKYGIIPQLSKGGNMFSDLKWSDGVKNNLNKMYEAAKDSIRAGMDENRTVQRQNGEEVRRIPIYYTRLIDSNDLKLDLLEGVLKFSQMSNNYYAMTEIEPNIIVLKTILNGDFNLGIKGREVAKTSAKGVQVLNAITKKVVPKMAREDMLDARLNEFINDVVYGDSEFEQAANIAGMEVSLNKLSNKVALFTALQTMAVNINGGISNVVVGNFNNSIEAVGGRFWGKRDWLWAQGEYWKEVPKFVAEVSGGPSSFINELAEYYDVPQGEFKDNYGENISKGTFNKLMKTSTLFFLQKGGEHQIQITGMLSLMRSVKVTDKTTGQETSLYVALKETEGNPAKMLERYGWTEQDDKNFRNRLHAIVKNLQGVYNSFDKAMLSRRWYGKLAIMFRKYLFKAMTSRWGKRYVDYELGTDDGGYWLEFMNKLYADIKEYKWGAVQRMWTKDGYDDFQRAAINKTLYEFGVIIATFALIGVAASDDDKSWLDAEVALQLTRFSADITQYINPADFIRVIRNPAASINMLEKWISWFTQLFKPMQEYERASGFAKAGDKKLYIKTLKLMPVLRQFINILTPEEQIKFYQLTGR